MNLVNIIATRANPNTTQIKDQSWPPISYTALNIDLILFAEYYNGIDESYYLIGLMNGDFLYVYDQDSVKKLRGYL